MEVTVVRYCTGHGTERDPAHRHEAYYSLDGRLLVERCTLHPLDVDVVSASDLSIDQWRFVQDDVRQVRGKS